MRPWRQGPGGARPCQCKARPPAPGPSDRHDVLVNLNTPPGRHGTFRLLYTGEGTALLSRRVHSHGEAGPDPRPPENGSRGPSCFSDPDAESGLQKKNRHTCHLSGKDTAKKHRDRDAAAEDSTASASHSAPVRTRLRVPSPAAATCENSESAAGVAIPLFGTHDDPRPRSNAHTVNSSARNGTSPCFEPAGTAQRLNLQSMRPSLSG